MNCFYTDDSGLDFLMCGNLQSDGGFVHIRRTFDCNVLIFVLEGTLHITQNGIPFSVSEGEYIFLNEGCEHFGHKATEGKLSYMWAHFRTENKWKTASEKPQQFSFFIPEYGKAKDSRRVKLLFRQLMDYSRNEIYTPEILTLSTRLILMELTNQAVVSSKTNENPVVSEVSAWIKANCHKRLTIQQIADKFHYNAEYLSGLFKKETDLSLLAFLNKERIELSKALLLGSRVSVKETAYSCGFNDEKYFMKLFKQHEGMTPMEFRDTFSKKYINT